MDTQELLSRCRRQVPSLPAIGEARGDENPAAMAVLRMKAEIRPNLVVVLNGMFERIRAWRSDYSDTAGIVTLKRNPQRYRVEKLSTRDAIRWFKADPKHFYYGVGSELVRCYLDALEVALRESEDVRANAYVVEAAFQSIGVEYTVEKFLKQEIIPGMGISAGLGFVADEKLERPNKDRVRRIILNSKPFILNWASLGVDAHEILRKATIGIPSQRFAEFRVIALLEPEAFVLVDAETEKEHLELSPDTLELLQAEIPELGSDMPYTLGCAGLRARHKGANMVGDSIDWVAEVSSNYWSMMQREKAPKKRKPIRKRPRSGKRRRRYK